MILNRQHWTKQDVEEYEKYLLSFSKGKEKGDWEQRIVNTNLLCIAVPSDKVKEFIKEIAKGNYIEFLNFWIANNLTEVTIIGGVIVKIKEFDVLRKFLDKFIHQVDNWANVDSLKFNINDKNKQMFFELAEEYRLDKHCFARRLGVVLLFKYVDDDNYIDEVLEVLNKFQNEQEYYVNMALAWLFAECFTKQKSKTVEFLKNHTMNKYVINKGIQKCRDSFRISKENKDWLLQYKIK